MKENKTAKEFLNECELCRNYVIGTIWCSVCFRSVHELPECSLVLTDIEGNKNPKRICIRCSNGNYAVSPIDFNSSGNHEKGILENPCSVPKLQESNESTNRDSRSSLSQNDNYSDSEDFPPFKKHKQSNVDTTKDVEVQNEKTARKSRVNCSLCRKNVSSMNLCLVCHEPVHDLPQCSIVISNIGAGSDQERVCVRCSRRSDVLKHIDLNAIENHGGMAMKDLREESGKKKARKTRTRRNLWLGESKDKIRDALTYASSKKNNKGLPILKCGSRDGLALIKMNEAKVSLHNTCGFDSIFQVFIAGLVDHPGTTDFILREASRYSAQKMTFFHMLLETKNKGVSKDTYHARAYLHLQFLQQDLKSAEILDLDCRCEKHEMSQFLLKEYTSLTVNSRCPGGCSNTPAESEIRTLQMRTSLMSNKSALENQLLTYSQSRCSECGKFFSGTAEWGELICIATYNLTKKEESVSLSKLVKKFRVKCNNYFSLGLIHYFGEEDETSLLAGNIGHFKGATFRESVWTEFCNQAKAPKMISPKTNIQCKLLYYFREKLTD